ncbi:DUF7575 domain-containing protein [Halovenus halobia]|uniref:DUF7575 domain-containing protein n=1 Tax=Halovenus halobia TaxID=3396622 RepID=UPI003F542F52
MAQEDTNRSRKRPWFAVGLTMLVPGLGHLYLRLWGRAVLWIVMTGLGLTLAAPAGALPNAFAFEAMLAALSALTVGAVLDFFSSLPLESVVLLCGVLALCIVDVYLMALRRNALVDRAERVAAGEQPRQCPNCGREVDPDIDFCHWCTTELAAEKE